jgi:tRNA modification GTPase
MGLLRQAKTLPAALDALREQEPGPVASAACRAIIERGAIFDWYAAPARVALVGPPNAGKSTLANALAGRAAALVSPTAGTTRDWLEIPAEIGGFPAAWLDTAGLRPTADPLETAGIERTHRVMAQADAVVFVLDGDPSAFDSQVAFAERYAADRPACVLLNKADDFDATRPALLELARRWPAPALPISAARGTGVAEFTALLLRSLGRERSDIDSASAFTARQREELGRAIAACEAADAAAFRAALDAILRQDPA